MDTNHGKRNAYLDLSVSEDRQTAARLVRDGDVFVQSYRPGALARYGPSVPEMVHLNPHLIAINLNCYGHSGPWQNRPGFEQLPFPLHRDGDGAGGRAETAAGADIPERLPERIFSHPECAGCAGATGAGGGAWQVDVSLCRTATWLQQQGMVDGWQNATGPEDEWVQCCMATENGPFGELTYFQ